MTPVHVDWNHLYHEAISSFLWDLDKQPKDQPSKQTEARAIGRA